MRWFSRNANSIIAGTICGIFTLLLLFGIRALTINSHYGEVTFIDIFRTRHIYHYEPNPYVAPRTSRQEQARPETSIIGSSETDGNVLVQDEYYIIVYSFKDLLLAQQKTRQLINDFNTKFILLPPIKDSYYRISYGKYSTLEEAKTKIISVRKTIKSDAWILSVKE